MKFVQNIKVNSKVYIHNYPRTVKKFLDAWYVLRVACYALRVAGCEFRVMGCDTGVGKGQRTEARGQSATKIGG